MGTTRNTEGFPTLAEVDRPLTAEEDLAFEMLDSPLKDLFTREYAAYVEFFEAGDMPRAYQQSERVALLRKFHARTEQEQRHAPREITARYVTNGLELWIGEKQHLSLDVRVGLSRLLIEARNAYLEVREQA